MKTLFTLLSVLSYVSCENTFFDTPNTYIQYRHWVVTERGILTFSFRTFNQNCLLLYTDGGSGSTDFLKLQLINEKLVVHTNFGSGTETFELGEELSNGVFHTVQINVEAGLMTVYLDQSYSKEQRFDNSAADNILQIQTFVFVGGVNKFHTADMVQQNLALEPRFTGCIKDLKFTRTGGETLGTPLIAFEDGTKDGCGETSCENLSFTDSCRNNGRCEPQLDGSHQCNCERTGYSGVKCTTAATVAKFQASEYIKYIAEDDPITSKYDSLSFRIKTSRANGLVFYYKTDNFFMAVEIVDSEISMNVGFSTSQQLVTLDDRFFISDNEWHEVRIGRYESFITLEVDGTQKSERLVNPTLVKYNKEMFIGGGESLTLMEGVRSKLNFVGCLQQLTFNKIQMLKDAKSEVAGYSTHGRLEWMCSDIQYVPVMFGSSEARLELDPWMLNREMSLQFKTSHPDGVIAFTGSDSTYLALQLVSGSLVFSAKKNGNKYEAQVGSNLADSNWHSLTARYDTEGINIHIYGDIGDVQENSDRFQSKGDLDIREPLILGDSGDSNTLFGSGYRGCIRGFSIMQEVVDLYTKLVNQPPGVVAGCGSLEEACSIQPCYHGSLCHQEMNSFTCDCTGTGYEGSVCSEEADSLTFSGKQYLRQLTSYPVSHERDSISFRFRSQVEKGLLMFITTDTYNEKFMLFEIINGKLYVIAHFGVQKFFMLEPLVSDGRWHVVQFHRTGNSITLSLDDTEVKYSYPGAEVQFPYQYAYLGSAPESEWRNVVRMTKSRTAFDGCLQQVNLNGDDLIRSAGAANILKNARPGCKFQETTDQQIAAFVRHTYLRLPPWTVSETISSLNFNFRTMESSGLVLFHGDVNSDFVAVELVQGRLKTTLTIGDGIRTVSSLIGGLNDNVWHSVGLEVTPDSFTLEVDGTPMQQPLSEAAFSFSGGLYIGGLPENVDITLLPYSIQENPSFLGCVKALIVNEVIQDLLQAGNGKSGVRSECENSCAAYPCQNGGNCRQLENQFDCLCSGTFFKGKTCSEDMALVRFTAGSTLRYTFYEHKTTIKDDLHIKFKTTNTDGGLVQVQTEDPNQFIKLEIKDSYLEVSMKIGYAEAVFARSPAPVNDDIPHTLSLWRRDTDVSYSFDGSTPQTSSLDAVGTLEFGVIMTVLLSFPVKSIQFSGCILGFDYNGITPLEDMGVPNIVKSPGVIEGSCDSAVVPTTEEPEEEEKEEEKEETNEPDNGTDTKEDKGDDDKEGNNEIDIDPVTPDNKGNNSTASETHTKNKKSLGLPIILLIAAGGFLCILVVIYGVSRFARRRQGVYKTNEDKRVADAHGQRVEYDKLTIHEEAFELPSKRELYM